MIKYILVSFLFLLTNSMPAQDISDEFVVVLDAGHGGKDPGRPTKFDTEKEIALKIVLKLGKELEKIDGIKVIYTRKTDVFVDLHERGAIANRADADLFISVHCNAHHTQAHGTETYVLGTKRGETNFNVAKAENEVIYLEEDFEKNYEGYNPNSPESLIGLTLLQEDYLDQSILLASYIQDKFTNTLKRKNRGVKYEGFIVLHQTYMPSVLVETGFITNNKEGAYLSSKRGQSEVANAIKNAVLKYRNSLNSNDITSNSILKEDKNQDEEEIINNDSNVIFKVQIAAGSRKLDLKPYNFNGLDELSILPYSNGYKYFYGESSNYSKIKSYQKEAIKKGYKNCFIVAFRDGKQITINDELKTTSN